MVDNGGVAEGDWNDGGPAGGQNDDERATVEIKDRSSDQLDTVFELLSDVRRRHALYCLRTRDQPIGVADLAGDVAAEMRDVSPDAVPDEVVESICTALYHVHLPKLESEDCVRFHHDRRHVAIGEGAEALAPYISLAAAQER